MHKNKSIKSQTIAVAVVLILIICLLITGGFLYKKTSNIRNTIKAEITELKISMKKTDISSYKPMVDEDGAWYTKYHFIAHAGGQ